MRTIYTLFVLVCVAIFSASALAVPATNNCKLANKPGKNLDGKANAETRSKNDQQNGNQGGSLYPTVYTNLMVPYNQSLQLVDGVAAAFDNRFSAAVDGNDAQKLWNFNENIALVRDKSMLAIEFRPVPKLRDTLFYHLSGLKNQPYALMIYGQYLPANLNGKALLCDQYLKTKTKINLKDLSVYNFTANSDTNSYSNRFMLIFERTLTTTAVPVTRSTSESNPNTTGSNITLTSKASAVTIYPNPIAQGGTVVMKFNNLIAGNYDIRTATLAGKTVFTQTINHAGGNANYPLATSANWPAGSYIVQVFDDKKIVVTKMIVVN